MPLRQHYSEQTDSMILDLLSETGEFFLMREAKTVVGLILHDEQPALLLRQVEVTGGGGFNRVVSWRRENRYKQSIIRNQ